MISQPKHIMVTFLLAVSLLLSSCQGKGKSNGSTDGQTADGGIVATLQSGLTPVPTPEKLSEMLQAAPEGKLQPAWSYGSCGSGDDQLDQPLGVGTDANGDNYIADSGNHRIVVVDRMGTRVAMWGARGSAEDKLEQPMDVSVTSDGTIYVLDSILSLIKHFDNEGGPLDEFGAELGLYHPRGLGLGIANNIWIADTGSGRLQETDMTGLQIQILGGDEKFVLGKGQPTDVAVDSKGNLWVVEASNGIIWSIGTDGAVRKTIQITINGSEAGPHMVIDPQDRIWVTDTESSRVLTFSPDGDLLGKIEPAAEGIGQFKRPVGIAVDASGGVIITDPVLCKVIKYAPQG